VVGQAILPAVRFLGTILVAWCAVPAWLVACGGPQAAPVATPASSASVVDAGGIDAADSAVERPFAKTLGDAQSMIQDQIDHKMTTLWKCVDAYRARKNDPHRGVVVDVGIDQEGHLLGLTPVGTKQQELDPTLRDCLWNALHGLPFPRSHAGVITVRQTFADAAAP
jgi:hypothetical protein